jgi:hypothetical protein
MMIAPNIRIAGSTKAIPNNGSMMSGIAKKLTPKMSPIMIWMMNVIRVIIPYSSAIFFNSDIMLKERAAYVVSRLKYIMNRLR